MIHLRRGYVPDNAHYVNPNGRPSERRHWLLVLVLVLLATAAFMVAALFVRGLPDRAPAPRLSTVTPATYGPPPAHA